MLKSLARDVLSVDYFYSPGPQNSEIGCISPSILLQYLLRYLPLNSAQVSEMQRSLLQLEMTGTYVYDTALISNKSPSPMSPRGVQSSPSQDRPWERKTILCYCDLRGENMADTICAERAATRGMERKCRRLVGNVVFLFLFTTDSPAVLYNHSPVL
jgi:hypothetical protein